MGRDSSSLPILRMRPVVDFFTASERSEGPATLVRFPWFTPRILRFAQGCQNQEPVQERLDGKPFCGKNSRSSAVSHLGNPSGVFMTIALVVFHVLISLFLILVVLIQQGKGADLAGAFGGGGSQTAFGARGTTTLLHKVTTVLFILFVITSLSLAVLQTRPRASVIGSQPAAPAVPAPAPSIPAP